MVEHVGIHEQNLAATAQGLAQAVQSDDIALLEIGIVNEFDIHPEIEAPQFSADILMAIADTDMDLLDTQPGKGLQMPFQQTLAVKIEEAFGGLVLTGAEAPTQSRGKHDGAHGNSVSFAL